MPYLTSDLLTSDEPIELTECPPLPDDRGRRLHPLELGQMFRRFGAEVTILERDKQLLAHGYEPAVGSAIATIFAEEGIRVVTLASVQSVRQEGNRVVANVQIGAKTQEFRADKLLVAAGRRANTDNIAIEKAGVTVGDQCYIPVDGYLRTNVPHIFATGDVIGRETGSQPATPVGSQNGGKAAHNALSGEPLHRSITVSFRARSSLTRQLPPSA